MVPSIMRVPERSLFGQVSRLVGTPGYTPREDRLTECFAALLERVPGLGLHLVIAWLETDPRTTGAGERMGHTAGSWSVLKSMPLDALRRVRTQVTVPGGRVDLELRFAIDPDVTAHEVVVRVEVKHGIDPHSGQLGIYERTLPQTGGPHAVVLLAPRADLGGYAAEEVPASVSRRSWQRTANRIKSFDVAAEPVASWLIEEFCTYLQEEQLMDPEAVGPEHLTALGFIAEANRALALVCERAHQYLVSTTTVPGPPTKESQPRSGRLDGPYRVGYSAWWYPPPQLDKERWNDVWFEWGTQGSNREAGVQGMFFYAGVSIDKDQVFDQGATRVDWRAQLEQGVPDPDDGTNERVIFRYWMGTAGRLWRVALPQNVLHGTTIEAQGESLGRWVEQTYRALIAFGVRRSSSPSASAEGASDPRPGSAR